MAGIKQIYRSPDAFRFPSWDYAISYPVNSVVAHYDSDSETPGKWRHYIALTQTTPGSLDSDAIRTNEWIEMAFDSETLYANALKAAKSIEDDLLAYLKPRFDSDARHAIDSELGAFEVLFKKRMDSDLGVTITANNNADSDKFVAFEQQIISQVNSLDSDNKAVIDSDLSAMKATLAVQDSEVTLFTERVMRVISDNDSDKQRVDARYAALSKFAFNNHAEIQKLKTVDVDNDSDHRVINARIDAVISDHDSDRTTDLNTLNDKIESNDSDARALVANTEKLIRDDFTPILTGTKFAEYDSDLNTNLRKDFDSDLNAIKTDIDSDYVDLKQALDDVYEQYIRIANGEVEVDSDWIISEINKVVQNTEIKTGPDSEWILSVSNPKVDSEWVLSQLSTSGGGTGTVDSDWVLQQLTDGSNTFTSSVNDIINNVINSGRLVDSEWVSSQLTEKTSPLNTDFINSVTEVVNSQTQNGEVLGGPDSEWVIRNIVSTPIDSDLLAQTINTVIEQAAADSIIDSDWVIRQFQQSSEFRQSVQNIVNQLTSTGNVVDSEYVTQQFTTNNEDFTNAVNNVINQATEKGLVGKVDSEWVLSLFTAGESLFDSSVRDVVNNILKAGNIVDSEWVLSQLSNSGGGTGTGTVDSDWVIRQLSAGTNTFTSSVTDVVNNLLRAGNLVDSEWVLSQLTDQTSPLNTDFINSVTEVVNSQAQKGEVLGGPDSEWVIRNIVSTPIDSDLLSQTINTVIEQATANSIIDSDWVIRQFQQSSEFEQSVQNIVNQLTSTGNVVDSDYVTQQFTTNNAEFSNAVTNVVNQAIESGLVNQVDSDWVIRQLTAGVEVSGADSDWVLSQLGSAGTGTVDSDWITTQLGDVNSPVYQSLANTLSSDTSLTIKGADSEWVLSQLTSYEAGEKADSEWITNQFNDPTSSLYQTLTQTLQSDTTVNLSGADSDWILEQITSYSPSPEADSEWITSQVNSVYDTSSTTYQNLVNTLKSDTTVNIQGADSEWITSQVNSVYDTSSTTYQNLVNTLKSDTTVNIQGADSDWIIRQAANVAVTGADSDWVQRLIDNIVVEGADSDWIVNQVNTVYDPTSTTYQNLVNTLKSDTTVSLEGADSDWILQQITSSTPAPSADSEWIVNQVNSVYDPTSTTYQNLVNALEADTTVNLGGGADSDWVLEQITAQAPAPAADSEWITNQVNSVYDTSSTTYQNLVDALKSDTTVNLEGADSDWILSQIPEPSSIDSDWVIRQAANVALTGADSDWVQRLIDNIVVEGADSDWIVNQVNTVYDPTSTTYQNLVDALEADTTLNLGGGVDSDWVISQIPVIPDDHVDSDYIIDYVTYEVDNIASSSIRWSNFASLVALPPYGTDRFTGMFAYVQSENRGYVASPGGWLPLAKLDDVPNIDIQADSEWILNNITNDDIQWIAYPTLGDLPSASTNHGMFAHVHAEGRGYFAHANAWVPLARLDDLDNLEIKADSDWIMRQIPTVKADSEWILKQIPEVKVDSDYVLRISNPEVDSDWVLRSVGVDSEYVLSVSNPEVDSEWVISQFGVLTGPRVRYEPAEESIGGNNAGSLTFTVDGGGTNKIDSITASGISAAWVTIEPNPTYWPIPVPETFIIINDQILAQFDDPGSALTTYSINGTSYFKADEDTGTNVILQPANEAIPIHPYGLSLGLTGKKTIIYETVAVDEPKDIDSEIKVAIKSITDIMQIMDSEIHEIYVQATRPENEADSDWVLRVANPQVDSEWVLGVSNPEVDSEWVLSVANEHVDSEYVLGVSNPEVDSEWVLSVSNPQVDSEWTINKLPTFFNMDYGTYT